MLFLWSMKASDFSCIRNNCTEDSYKQTEIKSLHLTLYEMIEFQCEVTKPPQTGKEEERYI